MSTKNAAPALLALLLFCSLPATTALAAAPTTAQVTNDAGVIESDGTTNRLGLEGEVRSEYAEPGPDLGSALTAADDELRVDHDRFVADREFEAAPTSEREERLESTLERIDERIAELETRERRAIERHANGEISDAVLLQTLVRNHNEAKELSASLEGLTDRANAVSGYTNRDETREMNHKLARYQSPIRAELDAVSQGSANPSGALVLVETEADGYRLATILGSSYVAETHRFDNRNETTSDQFTSITQALDYAEELYPWAYETASGSNFAGMASYGMYRVQVPHEQGNLDAHFDGGTRSVTDEVQELSVGDLPKSSTGNWSDDGLELALNETPANGPVEVTVTDSRTGSPVEATVAVDDAVVGETGDDGTLWIVPPTGEYELTAETDGGSVNATVAAD